MTATVNVNITFDKSNSYFILKCISYTLVVTYTCFMNVYTINISKCVKIGP